MNETTLPVTQEKPAKKTLKEEYGNWRYTCQGVPGTVRENCGVSSLTVQGPKKEALPQSARQSGFKPVQKGRKAHYCRKCLPLAVAAEKAKRKKSAN